VFSRHLESYAMLHYLKDDESAHLKTKFWDCLRAHDQEAVEPGEKSVGHVAGDRFDIQWWIDCSGQYFAVQALDKQSAHQWEMFYVPLAAGRSVVGRRSVWNQEVSLGREPSNGDILNLVWNDVFGPHLDEMIVAGRHPTFVDLLAAGLADSGFVSVKDNSARIASLTSDLEYWRGLAKSLSKAQKTQGLPYLGYQGEPVSQDVEPTKFLHEINEWTLRDIDKWAAANADRIIILPRAISETKRSIYSDPSLVYRCLELLANEYTQTKTGDLDRHAFRDKADAMFVSYGGSVDPSVAGEAKDQYFIRWNGRRRFLDQHLSKGSSRDKRFCLRVYFTWAEETNQVIVGWMPSHLSTSNS